jgi:hypothetical protein
MISGLFAFDARGIRRYGHSLAEPYVLPAASAPARPDAHDPVVPVARHQRVANGSLLTLGGCPAFVELKSGGPPVWCLPSGRCRATAKSSSHIRIPWQ